MVSKNSLSFYVSHFPSGTSCWNFSAFELMSQFQANYAITTPVDNEHEVTMIQRATLSMLMSLHMKKSAEAAFSYILPFHNAYQGIQEAQEAMSRKQCLCSLHIVCKLGRRAKSSCQSMTCWDVARTSVAGNIGQLLENRKTSLMAGVRRRLHFVPRAPHVGTCLLLRLCSVQFCENRDIT